MGQGKNNSQTEIEFDSDIISYPTRFIDPMRRSIYNDLEKIQITHSDKIESDYLGYKYKNE